MYRGVPTASKILKRKKKQRDDQILYEKLKSIKNRKSNYSLPRKLNSHKSIIQKNNYYKNQREKQIKRENKILASKMLTIENKKTKKMLRTKVPKVKKKPRSKSKNKLPRSLNMQKRKREMLRITMDNISLMNRIHSMKSFYNAREIGKHNYKHQKLLEMHCEYPVVLEKKGVKGKFFVNDEDENSSMMRKTRSYRIKRNAMTHGNRFTSKRGDSIKTKSVNSSQIEEPEIPYRDMSQDAIGSSKNDKKYPMTIENKKVNFEKKKYDCKVIKISDHKLNIIIRNSTDRKDVIYKTLFDHVYTQKMERLDFNINLFFVKILTEEKAKKIEEIKITNEGYRSEKNLNPAEKKEEEREVDDKQKSEAEDREEGEDKSGEVAEEKEEEKEEAEEEKKVEEKEEKEDGKEDVGEDLDGNNDHQEEGNEEEKQEEEQEEGNDQYEDPFEKFEQEEAQADPEVEEEESVEEDGDKENEYNEDFEEHQEYKVDFDDEDQKPETEQQKKMELTGRTLGGFKNFKPQIEESQGDEAIGDDFENPNDLDYDADEEF